MSYRIEPTSSGHPTLVADGLYLHNRVDPAHEARRWASAQRERLDAEPGATAVVLGLGLGYHVEALAEGFSGRIVVVEPDAEVVAVARRARDLERLLARVELAPVPLAPEAVDAWGSIVLCVHGPSVLRGGAAMAAVQERIVGRAVLRDLRLNILVVSPLGGGSHPITGYCARALADLGHAVTVLDLAPFAGGLAAIPSFSPRKGARATVEHAFTQFLGAGILAAVEAAEPDLVLAMAQAPLQPEVLTVIGARGAVRAFWFVEDHRLFPYWKDVVGAYDYFFAIQEGAFLEEAKRLSPGLAAYLPLAADPAVHRPLRLEPGELTELGAPVGFVGAGYRNRRIAFRPLLDLGLRIWGTEWSGAGPVEAAVQRAGARISTEDCVRIFNATDVNVNLHSSTYVDGVDPRGDFVNPRTFELAAAGAFQLVDTRTLLSRHFRPGEEVATFDDAAQLRDLAAYWLAHPDARRQIAAAGRARVLAEHTYHHRMLALLETMAARELARWKTRRRHETAADVARVDPASPLGRLCAQLPEHTPFTLAGVSQALLHREGDFSEAEAIMLFLHQFDEMYVRSARP
ncbi:MAG: glycosyltransferase [Candidatus Binatia bacterium]